MKMMTIRTRAQEKLRPPLRRHLIPMPTEELWLHHSAGPRAQAWSQIQRDHMLSRGWSDIAYSFGVQGGTVLEGRGPGVAGGHTRGRNTVSHGICVVGNFEVDTPTEEEFNTTAWLVAHGAKQSWWKPTITGPHSAAPGARTKCCGRFLARAIPYINAKAQEMLHPTPRFNPPLTLPPIVDELRAPNGGVWLLGSDGGVFAFGGAPFLGTVVGKPYWGTRTAARLLPNRNGYVIQATTGETYGWQGF